MFSGKFEFSRKKYPYFPNWLHDTKISLKERERKKNKLKTVETEALCFKMRPSGLLCDIFLRSHNSFKYQRFITVILIQLYSSLYTVSIWKKSQIRISNWRLTTINFCTTRIYIYTYIHIYTHVYSLPFIFHFTNYSSFNKNYDDQCHNCK